MQLCFLPPRPGSYHPGCFCSRPPGCSRLPGCSRPPWLLPSLLPHPGCSCPLGCYSPLAATAPWLLLLPPLAVLAEVQRMEYQESLYQPHHIKIMKVALALAIVRCKPEGVCAEEYTTTLAQHYRQQQTDWRKMAAHLERELLRTKQELVSAQVAMETDQTMTEPCQTNTQVDPTQTDWTSSGYFSSLPQDTPANKIATSVTWQGGGSSTVPSSHSNSQSDRLNTLQERIRGHVKFCSSVSAIVGVHGQLSDLVTFDLRANLHATLLNSLQGLTEALECGVQLTISSLETLFFPAASAIVDCLQLQLLAPVLTDLATAAQSLISALVQHILRTDSSTHAVLCSVLVVLSGVPGGVLHIVREIVTVIINCSQHLKLSLEDIASLDVELIESVGELTCALEELLTTSDPTSLTEEVRMCFVEELECSARGLIDHYPLFCYSVWRIVSHLHNNT